MATELRIDGEIWRLPEGTNFRSIHAQIVQAIQDGSVIQIPVEATDESRFQTALTINGGAVGRFALITR